MSDNKNGRKVSRYEVKSRGALIVASSPNVAALSLTNGNGGEIYYDRRAASVLAEIASWGYSDGEVLLDELHRQGFVNDATCQQVSVSNEAMLVVSTAFFIRSGKVGVICFRGTEPSNAINFLTDASCSPIDLLSLGSVHGGFYRNVSAVWKELAEEVNQAIHDEHDPLEAIYITGHSLGAAMAVIAGAIIFGDPLYVPWRPLVRGIYTYGQPMVGTKEFAKSCGRFEKILFRHIYGHDLVPRLPPATTGAYEHFGSEFHGSEAGWAPRGEVSRQVISIALSIPIGVAAWVVKQIPLLGWIRLPLSIDDHSPNSYLEAFRAAAS
jgi:hypothetical protein